MSKDTFGFYSSQGEALAQRLLGGVMSDLAVDRITRRQSLNRIADALERVLGVDCSPCAQETFDAIAERLLPFYKNSGFIAISGSELRAHCDEWSRRGAATSVLDACPETVIHAAEFARHVSDLAAKLSERSDLVVAFSSVAPWMPGFCTLDGALPGDLVFFSFKGDVAGNVYIGCVTTSVEGVSYLDDLIACGAYSNLVNGVMGKRTQEDCQTLADDLVKLNKDITRFNHASAATADTQRFALGMRHGANPGLEALWDGEPLPDKVPTTQANPASVSMSVFSKQIEAMLAGKLSATKSGKISFNQEDANVAKPMRK